MAEGNFIRRSNSDAQKTARAAPQEESPGQKRIRMLRHYMGNSPKHPDFAKWKAELADLLGKPDEGVSRGEAPSLPLKPLKPLEPETHPLLCKAVQLPVWPETTRGIPNGVLRSALFGVVERGARRYMEVEQVATQAGIEIFYTGRRLDQADLDVWQAVLHVCRHQVMGAECRFTALELLHSLGRTNTGKNYKVLDTQLARLNATGVRIKIGRYSYEGSLIDKVYRDHETKRYVVKLNSDMHALFEKDQFSLVDWSVRRDLVGKPLAQWLHGFYVTHAEPFALAVGTLRELCGSEIARERAFKEKLIKALEAVAAACAGHGEAFLFAFEGENVCVQRAATPSQQRHLAKKRRKSSR